MPDYQQALLRCAACKRNAREHGLLHDSSASQACNQQSHLLHSAHNQDVAICHDCGGGVPPAAVHGSNNAVLLSLWVKHTDVLNAIGEEVAIEVQVVTCSATSRRVTHIMAAQSLWVAGCRKTPFCCCAGFLYNICQYKRQEACIACSCNDDGSNASWVHTACRDRSFCA